MTSNMRGEGSSQRAYLLSCWVVVGSGVAVVLYRFVSLCVRSLAFDFPLDFGEGAVLDVTARLLGGENVYRRVADDPPWFVANYPPVYHLVRSLTAWIGGLEFWHGRLLSQVAAVGTAALIGSVARRVLAADAVAAAAGALTFLAIPFVISWAQYDRVDLLALFLNWAGLWFLVRRRSSLPIAVVCFILSSFTRQTGAVAGVAAAYILLLDRGSARAANSFLASFAGSGALILLALHFATGGAMFHLVTGTVGKMSLEQFRNMAGQLVDLMPLLVVTTAATTVYAAWKRPVGWTVVVGYTVGSALLVLTVAKQGSYINYFLDFCAAAGLCVAGALTWSASFRMVPVMVGLAVTLEMGRMGRDNPLYSHLNARLGGESEYRRLAHLVAGSEGPWLADEALGLLVTHGAAVDVHPFAMTQLSRAGLWNQQPFLRRLERQHYQWVLLRIPRANPRPSRDMWTAEMIAAIEGYYEPHERFEVSDRASIVALRARSLPRAAGGLLAPQRLDR